MAHRGNGVAVGKPMASQNRTLDPKTRAQLVGIGILIVLAMITAALTTDHRLELRGTISAGPPITDPRPLDDLVVTGSATQ